MAIILDADVIISGEKGRFDLAKWSAAQAGEELRLCAVTVAELWHGVERATGAIRSRREQYLQLIVSSMAVLPYTESTAYWHARVWADLEKTGEMIGYYDVIVAAAALEHGNHLASFNERHFRAVQGLKLVVPQ